MSVCLAESELLPCEVAAYKVIKEALNAGACFTKIDNKSNVLVAVDNNTIETNIHFNYGERT